MNLSTEKPKIVVVGSSSLDLVFATERHPKPNETVMAEKTERFFGGKGANQAVGTARLGASVSFVSCVGADDAGREVFRNLKAEGINVDLVNVTSEADTGTAFVTSAEGRNTIVVVPGANVYLTADQIQKAESLIEAADLVLLQLEIPMEAVEFTVGLAQKYNTKVLVYAAPAARLSAQVQDYASFIVAKSSDLAIIFGDDNVEDILKHNPNKLFIRDDTNVTTYYSGSEMKYYRNDHQDMQYRIGMGDAFTSGFAVAYCHGNSIGDCVRFGTDVSLRVALNQGSQAGLPFLEDMSSDASEII
ncbi:ribokinase [Marnyiella aurantia]|uniref:Ribokinase n=1 Tax=Marnyiella aurantia TaxID=2758037 RepID=A0A7D7LT79_9FLAO|nr:ribokinase [Marnyiella aurantia]MBA5247483.1 ribokinase [Marnyiella aurantia]QMS99238.1 ribokinase [Marnyiella aurantia]